MHERNACQARRPGRASKIAFIFCPRCARPTGRCIAYTLHIHCIYICERDLLCVRISSRARTCASYWPLDKRNAVLILQLAGLTTWYHDMWSWTALVYLTRTSLYKSKLSEFKATASKLRSAAALRDARHAKRGGAALKRVTTWDKSKLLWRLSRRFLRYSLYKSNFSWAMSSDQLTLD